MIKLGFLALLPLFVSSASSGHGEGHGSINFWGLGAQYKDAPALGWLTLTFIIFIYFLLKTIKKPLSLYLETRSQDIKKQIEEGQRAKEEGQKKLQAFEEKLMGLNHEIANMKEQFSLTAKEEKLIMQKLANEEEQKIIKDAEDSIKASWQRLKNDLSQELLKEAFLEAKKELSKDELGKDIDKSLRLSIAQEIKMPKGR